MNGAMPLPYTPLWCGEGRLYLYLYVKFTLPSRHNDALMHHGVSGENDSHLPYGAVSIGMANLCLYLIRDL